MRRKTNYWNVNAKNRCYGQVIAPIDDGRGRHPAAHKFEHQIITEHINSYNPSISHYTRVNAPFRRYLNPDITIRMMYNNFIAKQKSRDARLCEVKTLDSHALQ